MSLFSQKYPPKTAAASGEMMGRGEKAVNSVAHNAVAWLGIAALSLATLALMTFGNDALDAKDQGPNMRTYTATHIPGTQRPAP